MALTSTHSGSSGEGPVCGSFIALLGRGRWATVQLFRRPEDGAAIALKRPSDPSSDSTRRLDREFSLLQHIAANGKCDFIATALFLRSSPGEIAPCLGLSAGLGGSLHRHIARRGSLPLDIVRVYTSELVAALVHLARHNCIHRDLKANNVVLTDRGHVLLCDFDQAVVLCSPSTALHATEKSEAFTLTGVPHAMSPEAVGGVGYNCKADWWALGVLVYEMLMGEPTPFGRRDEAFPSQQDRSHIRAVLSALDHTRIPLSEAWICRAAERLGPGADDDLDTNNEEEDNDGGDLEAILKRFASQQQRRERPLRANAANFVQRLLEINPQLRLGIQSAGDSRISGSETFRRELAEVMSHPWIIRSVAEGLEVAAVDFDESLGHVDILSASKERGVETIPISSDPFADFG